MAIDLPAIIASLGGLLTIIVGGFVTFYKLAARSSTKVSQGTEKIIGVLSASEGRTQVVLADISNKHGILISRFDKLETSVGLRLDRVEQQISSLQELHRMASQVEVGAAKIAGLEKEVDALRTLKHQMQNEQQIRILRSQIHDQEKERDR